MSRSSSATSWPQLRREDFGFVFQGYHLIPSANAAENVEVPAMYCGMPAAERHGRAKELLGELGLAERLHHRPNQLSGGQQQRVSIARALMNGGRIILADEPTGALDSKSGADVMKLLSELSERGHTVILITHAKEVALHANRVIEIKDGNIVSDPGPAPQPMEQKSFAPSVDRNGGTHIGDVIEAAKMAVRSLRANMFRSRQASPAGRAHVIRPVYLGRSEVDRGPRDLRWEAQRELADLAELRLADAGFPRVEGESAPYMRAVELPPGDAGELWQRLYDGFRVEVPVYEWAGRRLLRVSIGPYNDEDDVTRLLGALDSCL